MNQNKKKLLAYLKSQDLLVLATGSSMPHAAILYYGIDDEFTLTIMTPPNSKHGEHIKQNSSVACAIVDTTQHLFSTEKKTGAQITGNAREITEEFEIEKALSTWCKDRKDAIEKYMSGIRSNTVESRPFIIKPKEIKWFNEDLFGPEGTELFRF